MTSSTRRTVGVVALLLLGAGCGTEPAPLYAVRGKVFYQGSGLRAGTIVFTPDPTRGGSGPMARAEIQSDGSYVLRTDDRAGAVAGWHRVTVLAVQPGDAPGPRPSLVPRRYSDPELSGLSAQVKSDRANTFDFHLE